MIVENHGSLSSNGAWLTGVMRLVDHPRCGTLPDFGNFYEYDRYKGVAEMMPYAKGVSAKTHDFDAHGQLRRDRLPAHDEDRARCRLSRPRRASSTKGKHMSEPDGIRATKRLLERVASELGGTTA